MRNIKSYNRPRSFSSLLDDVFNRSIMDLVGNDMIHTSPMVNIIENEDNYVIEVAAPGMKKENFDVQIVKNSLVIKAELSQEAEAQEESSRFTRRAFQYGSFTKSYTLSDDINKDSIEGKYENGILYIALDKIKEGAKQEIVKRIEIG